MEDVSVIVCTKNAVSILEPCLVSVLANEPGELIVVDGVSTDGTFEVAQKYTSCVLSDGAQGLAFARNLGLARATWRYVAYIGPDNILPSDALSRMIEQKEKNGWVGVSAVTHIFKPANYLSRSMNKYKSIRFFPGERSVIGTPTLFDRTVLADFKFDPSLTSSDDSDLCSRLTQAGYKLGIADVIVYEVGTCSLRQVLDRWLWYGQSDAEYYCKYSGQWTLQRKLSSFSHPLNAELLGPIRKALAVGDWSVVPFLMFITITRYVGWLKAMRQAKLKLSAMPIRART